MQAFKFNFLTNEILWTFLSSQSKREKSYWQCSRHFEYNSLIFVCGKFTASFPLIYSRHLTILGLVIIKKKSNNKLTSVVYASVFLLLINFVMELSKFTAEPLASHADALRARHAFVGKERVTSPKSACGSWFHSHFDNVMAQFVINKRTDALKNWRRFV